MGKLITNADKQVLADIVRFTQKHNLKGEEGGWKEYLVLHDRKLGACLSDPYRRSRELLAGYLKSFSPELRKYFDKLIKRYREREDFDRYIKKYSDSVTPEQRLVLLTREHPEFNKNYIFPSYEKDWKVVRSGAPSKLINSRSMISVDCEMVLCQDGTEAVVRLCAVDSKLQVMLDELVNPGKAVADYRTHITGISADDLHDITLSLADVQKSLLKLLKEGTILIGHSLFFDLSVLKLDYPQIIDTIYIFKYLNLPVGVSPSLNSLCKSILGSGVREDGEAHNCFNDAKAAMQLVLAKLENGYDEPIMVVPNSVPEEQTSKLLIHKIPIDVLHDELLNLFPGKPTIDKGDSRVRGTTYCIHAVFKNALEAEEAFKAIDGEETTDCGCRPQKHVIMKLRNGKKTSFYVRKMVAMVQLNNNDSNKRPSSWGKASSELSETNGHMDVLKKQKTCLVPCEHAKEIERLKRELNLREDEIFSLQKVLSSLSSKHDV